MRSASCSIEPVGSVEYTATVAVNSVIDTEGEEEREIIRRKSRMAIIVLRYGLALMFGRTIFWIVMSLLQIAMF